MAADAQSTLRTAELLLKQGKTEVALGKLDGLARGASRDLLVLNRIGDLLARHGKANDAIGYYLRIAALFSEQGFYPKAVAIHKKVLRLNPNNTECLHQLGELYVSQKLPGEARVYFLRAAEGYLAAQDFARARAVYERLVEVEPEDPRHRARLAESLAAQGENEKAGDELIRLADHLLATRQIDDAETTYERARELVPERSDTLLGLSRCRKAAGQEAEALQMLEEAAKPDDAVPAVLGALALQYEESGRKDDAIKLLLRPGAEQVPSGVMLQLFAPRVDAGDADELWGRFDAVLDRWTQGDGRPRALALLTELGDLEAHGHIPALERLYAALKVGEDRPATVRSLESLIRAHQARSNEDEAQALLAELEKIAPMSPLVSRPDAETPAAPARASGEGGGAQAELPIEAEAPAVPLNRGDEEFVTGRLTQAEILEKYGLLSQALDQVREVTAKFPGHEKAQERLVALLRESPEREGLRDAQVALALARRASGDADGAHNAAREARQAALLTPEQERLLQRLGLVDGGRAAPAKPAASPVVAAPPAATEPPVPQVVAPPAAPQPIPAEPVARAAAAAPSEPEPSRGDGIVLIDFDAMGDEPEPEMAAAAPQADDAPATPVEAATPTSPPPAAAAGSPFEDDDDLSTITAALESELFADDLEPEAPEADTEQSMGDVFAAFKQHVEQEVASDDYRTHYDLGIAYKEMGLTDEAISEFQVAIQSPELFREACSMLALCHREREEMQQAAAWYRQALEADGADELELTGLRYDLAEVLALAGERDEALSLFRNVLQSDPSFRQVQERIADLESNPTA